MIKKILTLGVLYFVQGIPYGFQDKFLNMYLRSIKLSHTKLSLMKLLLLPWLCKAAFAPLIDLFWTKYQWLLFSLCSLTILSLFGTFISTEYLTTLCIWLFLLNLFSAFQDVSVDSLALNILKKCELGHGNTAQIVGYKLGCLFGGGVLFWLHYYYGWSCLCLSLAGLYVISIVMFMSLYRNISASDDVKNNERSNVNDENSSANELSDLNNEKVLTPSSIQEFHENSVLRKRVSSMTHEKNETLNVSNSDKETRRLNMLEVFKLVFNTKDTFPVIAFLALYKLGERGALSTFPIFLVDQGIPMKDIGLWSGIIGQCSSLVGSTYAGCLISNKCDVKYLLYRALIARSVPIFFLWIIVNLWYADASSFVQSFLFFISVLSLLSLEFTAGLTTTLVFTLMMSCSLKAPSIIQGTHYSVLSSVEVAGKLLFSSFVGAMIDYVGLTQVYFLLFGLSTASVVLVPFVS